MDNLKALRELVRLYGLTCLYSRTTGMCGYGYRKPSVTHCVRIFDTDAYFAWIETNP